MQALLERGISGCDNLDLLAESNKKYLVTAEPLLSTSHLQKDVCKALRPLLGLMVTEEFVTHVGYAVDGSMNGLWRDADGRVGQLCVEVDGPSHFYAGTRQQTAATAMKHRYLWHFGWHVISVPYWEWGRSGDGSDAPETYLRSLLDRYARVS